MYFSFAIISGDTLGANSGMEEVAWARARCAWAEFKELSPY